MTVFAEPVRLSKFFAIASLAVVAAGCGSDSSDDSTSDKEEPQKEEPQDIVALAAATPELSTLVSLVKLCKLESALQEKSKKTVFAPTNAAFKVTLPDGLPKECSADLASILKHHVVGKEIKKAAIKDKETKVATLTGDIFVKSVGGKVKIDNSAEVKTADAAASNGVVHIINAVLLPDSVSSLPLVASKREDFSTLVSLLGLCKLDAALLDAKGTFTVFAPTNAAFTAYLDGKAAPTACSDDLKNTLLYHVVGAKVKSGDLAAAQGPETLLTKNKVFVTKADGTVTVNGAAKVVAADVEGSNGVIHAIDKVLVPDAQGNIVAALAKRYDYSTLVASVVKADLATTLSGTGPFTVFAPNNAAFTAIADTVASLSVAQLTKVLTHHVLGSKVLAADIATGSSSATAVDTTAISISNTAAGVLLRGSSQHGIADAAASKVTETDIVTTNGVIHTVSGVLVPTGL